MEPSICRRAIDSPEHRLIEKYIRVTRLHRSMMERSLECTGVYRSQHQILMFVSENPNVSQKELAKMYGVSGATIAVSLKKLEKGGYIRRLVDQKDNRCNQICITQKGRKIVEDSVRIFRRTEECMFEGFSEHDMKALGELLDRIYANLNRTGGAPDRTGESDGAPNRTGVPAQSDGAPAATGGIPDRKQVSGTKSDRTESEEC